MNSTPVVEEAPPAIATFDNSYARLPAIFFARVAPTPVREPRLIRVNTDLAEQLGIPTDALNAAQLAAVLSGNLVPAGAEPLAMAYAGHQFGNFVPQLGDGRAILLGEVVDPTGRRHDVQLKGSGRTPFSRAGDGRAALGPVLREYLVGEAMHALGIPGTRALAAVSTGESIHRQGLVPGAILTRVAASHVRVGTFQFFAARQDTDSVRRLADYVIDRHYPELRERTNPYLALLEAVGERQAALVARWLHVGFIHGVMNTDNMAVSGETIDFGPCAFMDTYDPGKVFSSIDGMGRYAYANQPHAAQWNIARFAETLLPLLDDIPGKAVDLATAAIERFPARFEAEWLRGMRLKCGFLTVQRGDLELIQTLLDLMHANRVDYTLLFRSLADIAQDLAFEPPARALFLNPGAFDAWAAGWRARLAQDGVPTATRAAAMRDASPAVIPRNHRVEQVIVAAVEHGDFGPFERLLAALAAPYADESRFADYRAPPADHELVRQTFCGT
jgi:uncharacterized protein YdiU (UPF0061 family)